MVGGGIGLATHEPGRPAVSDVGAIPQAHVQSLDGMGSSGRQPAHRVATTRSAPAQITPSPPVRVRIPRLHIDAEVRPVSTQDGGALAVPDNPRVTGWWSGGARPGSPAGSVVIDGHVDSATRGLGAFFRLSEVKPGDRVIVSSRAGKPKIYVAVARRSYPKSALPAAQIFSQAVKPRLVLVTCGGEFNRRTRNYLDNIVVYAVPR